MPYTRPAVCSFISAVRQPPATDGFTHASSVIAFVRSSVAESATLTMSLTPSKLSARPKRPEVVRVAPETVPALPLPEESVAAVPVVSSKP